MDTKTDKPDKPKRTRTQKPKEPDNPLVNLRVERAKVFEMELSKIQHEKFREFCKDLLVYVPGAFFKKAASSSGKFHPDHANTEGGLVSHTRAAFWIAYGLTRSKACCDRYSGVTRDVILAAILFHDAMKYRCDNDTYTCFEHPVLVKGLVEQCVEAKPYDDEIKGMISKMLLFIESHMGSWNTNKYYPEPLPTPASKEQVFVHMCNDLASFEILEFNHNRLDGFVQNKS